jgi:hypothetical protein
MPRVGIAPVGSIDPAFSRIVAFRSAKAAYFRGAKGDFGAVGSVVPAAASNYAGILHPSICGSGEGMAVIYGKRPSDGL